MPQNLPDIHLAYMRRKFGTNKAEILAIYDQAYAAALAGHTEVTITSSTMDAGGSASGEFRGNPEVIMAVCEQLLTEIEAAENDTPVEAPGTQAIGADFSQAQLRT